MYLQFLLRMLLGIIMKSQKMSLRFAIAVVQPWAALAPMAHLEHHAAAMEAAIFSVAIAKEDVGLHRQHLLYPQQHHQHP